MTRWRTCRQTAAIRTGAAGLVLAGLAAAGCADSATGPRPATVESCIQFGIAAIRHGTTVVSVPAACRGLSRVQVNFAVGSALHIMADTGRGKARQRERAIRLSPLLARLVTGVPAQPGRPARPGPPTASGPATRLAGSIPARIAALASWLVTVALGAGMLIRRIARSKRRSSRPGPAGRPPPLVLGHLGLAVTGLLAWVVFLATGVTGAGWAAFMLLLPVIGLGMALVILGPAGRPATAGPPPALIIAAHGVFAVLTITLVLLAVTGAS
jgi:hypothetical protein